MNRTRRRRAKFRRAMAPSTPSRLMFEGGPEYGRHPLMFEAFCRGWVTIDEYADAPQTFLLRVWAKLPFADTGDPTSHRSQGVADRAHR